MNRADEIPLLMDVIDEERVEVFREAGNGCATYAIVNVNGSPEVLSLNGQRFKRWLHWTARSASNGHVFSRSSVRAVAETLSAQAQFGESEHSVRIRVAGNNDVIYVDLGDDQRQIVEIKPRGWEVVRDCHEKFLRPPGMLPLPVPKRRGQLCDLKRLLNLDDHTWVLLSAALVAGFYPVGAHAVLFVMGPQASGKSLLCRMVRHLVDPHQMQLRSAATSERDLVISARHSWLVAYDNLSKITEDQSDTYCRLLTGGGFGTRQLYTDDAEFQSYLHNPMLINSIDELDLRSDFRSRMIQVTLPMLRPSERMTETDLWGEFERLRPELLGAIFDGVAGALSDLPSVTLPGEGLPRLSDLARFVMAASPHIGLGQDSFLEAYRRMESDADLQLLEDSVVGPLLLALMRKKRTFTGTCSQLLGELGESRDSRVTDLRQWPTTPRALSGILRRLQECLSRQGILIEFLPRQRDARLVHLECLNPMEEVTSLLEEEVESCK